MSKITVIAGVPEKESLNRRLGEIPNNTFFVCDGAHLNGVGNEEPRYGGLYYKGNNCITINLPSSITLGVSSTLFTNYREVDVDITYRERS